jgi:hypothetical protein
MYTKFASFRIVYFFALEYNSKRSSMLLSYLVAPALPSLHSQILMLRQELGCGFRGVQLSPTRKPKKRKGKQKRLSQTRERGVMCPRAALYVSSYYSVFVHRLEQMASGIPLAICPKLNARLAVLKERKKKNG